MNRVTYGAVLAAIAATALMASAGAADARVRHVSGTWQTPRGVFTGDSTVTRGRGFRDRNAVFTGPNGRQRTVQDNRTWDAQAGTYDRDHTVTYADGKTRTVDVDVQRTAPGQYAFERDVTGRNGQTRTQTGTYVIHRGP